VRSEASDAVARGATPAPAAAKKRPSRAKGAKARPLTKEPGELLPPPVGPAKAKKMAARLDQAADMFSAERFRDAQKALDPLVSEAPASADAVELRGLTLYRLEKWKEAARDLEAFRSLTHSTEQNPVLADCYRAMGRHDEVDALWAELKAVSPAPDLMTEGRLVAAGSLAERGRTDEALDLLGHGFTLPKKAKDHHLRRAYALADLYERAGDVPKARDLFTWLRKQDTSFADVPERLASLD
jgi:tetratricopeptide (TPR) repeat protein